MNRILQDEVDGMSALDATGFLRFAPREEDSA